MADKAVNAISGCEWAATSLGHKSCQNELIGQQPKDYTLTLCISYYIYECNEKQGYCLHFQRIGTPVQLVQKGEMHI